MLRAREVAAAVAFAAAVVLAAAAAAAPAPARADAALETAVAALRDDSSIKVRTQAALVLGQRGAAARAAVPALAEALARDAGAPVRLAAARALSRIGDPSARAALERAAGGDPDGAVRAAALAALAALVPAPRARPSYALQDPQGRGAPEARRAFKEALARHLGERGFVLADDGEVTLKPSVLGVEIDVQGETTIIAVKAGLVAVEPSGRMAAMLESRARLSAKGTIPEGKLPAYAARALDAAARTLCEDLAEKLEER